MANKFFKTEQYTRDFFSIQNLQHTEDRFPGTVAGMRAAFTMGQHWGMEDLSHFLSMTMVWMGVHMKGIGRKMCPMGKGD